MRKMLTRIAGLIKLTIIVAGLFVTTVFVTTQLKKYNELKAVEEILNNRIEEELQKQSKLLLEMEYTLSDTYVEKVARERLGLLKKDEILFIDQKE